MNKFFSIALISALAALPLAAQQTKPWEQLPTHPLHAFHPQQPKRVALPNGIVLFLQEDHELPFVHGSVLIPGGSHDEPAAKIGLVDLYGETWRTSGSATHNGDQLDDLLEAKAAHIESYNNDNSTGLHWDSLKGDADQVFDLAFDLLLHPKFDAQRLALAQQQLATSIVRRNDNEGSIAYREAAKLVYGADSPYARQAELATMGAVTVADLEAWHKKTIGNALIVSVRGDFDPAAMEAKLTKAFGALPKVAPRASVKENFTEPKAGLWFINKDDVNQSNIQLVTLGIDRHNPDVPAVAVMNEMMGGGFASRLFQRIRTKEGLAYAVSGGVYFDWDHPGTFQVDVMTKSESTTEAISKTIDELQNMTRQPVTAEEVARAKETLLNSFLFRYDTRAKVLGARVQLEFNGYPADYLEKYEQAIRAVTVEDVNRVAKKYVHPEKLAILVVGKGSEIKPSLDELKLGKPQAIDITIPMPKQDGK